MTDEFWHEVRRMAIAGGIVATVALPLAAIAATVIYRRRMPVFASWGPWRVPWSGFELTLAFVCVAIIPEVLQLAGCQRLAAGVIAFPIQLSLLLIAWRVLYPSWNPFRKAFSDKPDEELWRSSHHWLGLFFCQVVTLSVLGWLVLTPVVHLLNDLVTIVFTLLDLPMDSHPLTKLATGSAREQALFLVEACIVAPIIEEILFRGILLPWVIGARERSTGGLQLQPVVAPKGRPLVVMAVAALYAAGSGKPGPVILAGLLTLGLVVLWVGVRKGKRQVRAIYASAALFGLVHSSVWPSPIPLFGLGLGLGWLAVRTRGVLVPAVVHGLFNAVSAVYVLRGAT